MLISCRTSSYFSSIDKFLSLRQCLNLARQRVFAVEQHIDLAAVLDSTQLLEPVDLALDLGPLPVEPKPFQGLNAVTDDFCRRGGISRDSGDQLGVHST